MNSPEQTEPVIEDTATIGVPDDADDMRGYHFGRLMRTPLTLILVGALTAIVFVAGLIFVGAALGAGAALAALLLAIVVVFAIADNQAADDFFEVYAASRDLTLIHGRGRLPQATPLLGKGDDRYTERTLMGPIAKSCDEGTLALFTYEEETHDSDGDTQTHYYRYTLGLVKVPECIPFVPELFYQRKFGLRALEKFEDVFRGDKQRVSLESEALLDKYEIFAGKEQDANHLRRCSRPASSSG